MSLTQKSPSPAHTLSRLIRRTRPALLSDTRKRRPGLYAESGERFFFSRSPKRLPSLSRSHNLCPPLSLSLLTLSASPFTSSFLPLPRVLRSPVITTPFFFLFILSGLSVCVYPTDPWIKINPSSLRQFVCTDTLSTNKSAFYALRLRRNRIA